MHCVILMPNLQCYLVCVHLSYIRLKFMVKEVNTQRVVTWRLNLAHMFIMMVGF